MPNEIEKWIGPSVNQLAGEGTAIYPLTSAPSRTPTPIARTAVRAAMLSAQIFAASARGMTAAMTAPNAGMATKSGRR